MPRPMKPDKPKPKSIGFKNGEMKDEIERILDNPRMQELMTEEEKQFLSGRVYWAVTYLDKLLDRGRLDVTLPMFEPVRSAEVVGLETEVENLREKLFWSDLALSHMKQILDFEAVPQYEDAKEELRWIKQELEKRMREAKEKPVTVHRS